MKWDNLNIFHQQDNLNNYNHPIHVNLSSQHFWINKLLIFYDLMLKCRDLSILCQTHLLDVDFMQIHRSTKH